jgi:hypothetical protein
MKQNGYGYVIKYSYLVRAAPYLWTMYSLESASPGCWWGRTRRIWKPIEWSIRIPCTNMASRAWAPVSSRRQRYETRVWNKRQRRSGITASLLSVPQFDKMLQYKQVVYILIGNVPCGRSRWQGGLRPLVCWDHGLESRWGHGCLSLAFMSCVVLCR